jgi:hypothetical protein
MNMKNIEKLNRNEIIVIGSNESGIHGAGAAYQAYKEFGLKLGCGFGITGQTFAIPTKDWNINTLPLGTIKFYVDRFLVYAKTVRKTFLVTPIGTGLARYTVKDIAPLFKEALDIPNIVLPEEFVKFLTTTQDGKDK